jgi:hypothetical protein
MSKKFLVDLDLNKNQILNVRLQNLATAPTSPVNGQLYYNTVDNVVYFWNGTAWLSVAGDIQEVVAGSGLTGGGASGSVTIDLNPDNSTIEVNADIVRIKDLGVTTAKIADSAVTTAKIADANVTTAKIADNNVTTSKILDANVTTTKIADSNVTTAKIADSNVTTAKIADSNVTTIKVADNAITFAKMQDIATLTVIGRVTASSGDPESITVITDLANASSTTLATSASIKTYIDNTVAGLGNLEGSFAAATQTNFPTGSTPGAGTKKGDYWYVTTAGTVQGITLNIGDILIANKDNASTTLSSDWIFLESNRDQATTSVLGVVRLATTAEAQALTNTVAALTPATLATVTATETRTGIAELATQAETDAGTDDTRIVTPLKLVTYITNRTGGYSASIGNGSNTSFALSHGLNTKDVVVEVYENSTGESVITDVTRDTVNQVTISFASAPASNAYRVVIKK